MHSKPIDTWQVCELAARYLSDSCCSRDRQTGLIDALRSSCKEGNGKETVACIVHVSSSSDLSAF